MKRRSIIGVVIGATLLCVAVEAVAQDEPERGRLPDGRAFRTDSDGNQLVDYIAELEMNLDGLNRRLAGLEGELERKNTELTRFEKGDPVSPQLAERTIVGKESHHSVVPGPFQSVEKTAAQSCPPAPKCPDVSRVSVAAECPAVAACDCSEKVRVADESYEKAKREIESLRKDLKTSGGEHAEMLAKLEKSVSDKDVELKASASKITGLQAKVQQLADSNSQLTQQVALRAAELASAQQALVSSRAALNPKSESLEYGSDSLESARMKAVISYRTNIANDVQDVRRLLLERESIYKRRANAPGPVTFSVAEPRSKDNLSLKDLDERARQMNTMKSLSQVQQGVAQIKQQVVDDIALLKRLERIGPPGTAG